MRRAAVSSMLMLSICITLDRGHNFFVSNLDKVSTLADQIPTPAELVPVDDLRHISKF